MSHYKQLDLLWEGHDGERVLKAERPLPPFGVCDDKEVVVVKEVPFPAADDEAHLFRLSLEVCLRNYFSHNELEGLTTIQHSGLFAKVKDFHVEPTSVSTGEQKKTFAIVSEHHDGVPLSQYPLMQKKEGGGGVLVESDPKILEEQIRWVTAQLVTLAQYLATSGWSHSQFGGIWSAENFLVDSKSGDIKLVDFGLENVTASEVLERSTAAGGQISGSANAEISNLLQSWRAASPGFSAAEQLVDFSSEAKLAIQELFVAPRAGQQLPQAHAWLHSSSSGSRAKALLEQVLAYSASSAAAAGPSAFTQCLRGLLRGATGKEESAKPSSESFLTDYLHRSADLWLFGYGSLLWKQNFEFVGEPLKCYVKGYERLFTQGSTDHRGVPGKPGRVVTLEPRPDDKEAKVLGLMFQIPEAKKEAALTALDIREKGGYERHMMVTYPLTTSKSQGGGAEKKEQVEEEEVFPFPSLVYIANTENEEYLGMDTIENLAHQIYHSVGPSGPNKDYLLNMVQALRKLDMLAGDKHLSDLEAACLTLERKGDEA